MEEVHMGSFTSFLKKAGQVLSSGLAVLSFVFPVLRPLMGSGVLAGEITTGVNDFTAIGTQIITIETALQGKTGPEKLAAASTLVAGIVRTSELVTGHKIANEAEFIAGCQDLTNATVRIMNSLDASAVKTV
jgi:hypothetical protein